MNGWEEAEARAHRAPSPASLSETLLQRFTTAGLDPVLACQPAYDLACLFSLSADFVKLTESLLLAADGDRAAMRRTALQLDRWTTLAAAWADASAQAFNQLLDSLELEKEQLMDREAAPPDQEAAAPAELSKVDGRYRLYHFLYERLELKLESAGMPEEIRRGLARSIARVYEQSLLTVRLVARLERESKPHFRQLGTALLEVNTAWHFDLALYHLRDKGLRPRVHSAFPLSAWLMLGFGQ